ncbi:uncharacterized protein [Ovis canadensis]|uniref:uncharacterized protein isoform X1 n=1 Tax=Ovis canadensis TaxID=37174 RepID=UPI00375151A8
MGSRSGALAGSDSFWRGPRGGSEPWARRSYVARRCRTETPHSRISRATASRHQLSECERPRQSGPGRQGASVSGGSGWPVLAARSSAGCAGRPPSAARSEAMLLSSTEILLHQAGRLAARPCMRRGSTVKRGADRAAEMGSSCSSSSSSCSRRASSFCALCSTCRFSICCSMRRMSASVMSSPKGPRMALCSREYLQPSRG